jgi:hypothetical protein
LIIVGFGVNCGIPVPIHKVRKEGKFEFRIKVPFLRSVALSNHLFSPVPIHNKEYHITELP